MPSCDIRMITTFTSGCSASVMVFDMRSAAPKNIAPSRRRTAIFSSPGRGGPGSSSRVTLLRRATLRNAKTAATTTPIWTASIRSNATVITAVSTNVTASDRVEARIRPTVRTDTMRIDVTISTAASAVSGIAATGPLAR